MKAYDIERYINGELEGEELHEFETLLGSDADLRDEVNKSRIVIGQLKQLSISEKIKKAQQKNKHLKRWRLIFMLSIFSLGILCLLIYFKSDSTPNVILPSTEPQNKLIAPDSHSRELTIPPELPTENEKIHVKEPPIAKNKESKEELNYEEIAMNYYSTPEEFAYLRGAHSQSIMDSARMEFNNENYKETLILLNSLPTSDATVEYFKAHVFLNLHQYEKANSLFKKVLNMERSKIKQEEIEWFILLNHLACGKNCKQKLMPQLNLITSNPKHSYHTSAKEIQRILK